MKWTLLWFMLLGSAGLCARLSVVASNGIVADWVQQLGGTKVTVDTFAEGGGDPHHFEPFPRQLGALAKANLVVGFGAGLEPWLADALKASGSKAMVLELSDGLELMAPGVAFWETMPELYPDAEHKPPCCKEDAMQANRDWAEMILKMPCMHEGDVHGGHDHKHDHGDYDPHVWLDPQLAVLMVLTINMALVELDPANAEYYDQNRERYLNELIELDEWAKARLGEVPTRRRILINYHDNLRYFGRRYGFFTPASVLGNVSTEAPDPSARQFSELIKMISELDVPAVFVDATANSRLSAQLAREAGLPKPFVLYTGNVTSSNGLAPDYISLMRSNVETIVTALD
ncbi:metal ABC transporter substrate-binding protein [Cerasicoccus maritimus]|uniref:metal ABC transporter substrate-binding protein n=1 Tax=Cerasicoccus maritimus TaxID=490089 RepID=UPI002852C0BE|nr:metal ABC transporter substrate-binding protein [Cerasicoccus maritimus]